MNYIGRKATLFNNIKDVILHQSKKTDVFCDLFAGTGYVASNMRPYFNKVIANDFEYYAYVLNKHYVGNNSNVFLDVDWLNEVEPVEGLIYKNYCSPAGRLYFSNNNGKKIDGIRQAIEKYKSQEDYYFFALTSLLEAVDRIQNTTGIYAAFLKKLKKSAKKEIFLKPEHMCVVPWQDNEVYQRDAKELIKNISGDVLYLDPPYNRRQYGSNYHLLNTIARYEMPENITETTGLPTDYNKSKMCYESTAYDFLKEIIDNSDFNDIFISYNNEGIISKNDFLSISNNIEVYEFPYRRYKADNNRNNKYEGTIEYLYHIRK